MKDGIATFPVNSDEYKALDLAASILTFLSPNRYRYRVGVTYFDFEQDWAWTTIICYTGRDGMLGEYQALYPTQQRMILAAKLPEELVDIAKQILSESRTDCGLVHRPDGAEYKDQDLAYQGGHK